MDLSEKIIDKKEELLDEFENLSLDQIAKKIVKKNLSVRQTENLVRLYKSPLKSIKTSKDPKVINTLKTQLDRLKAIGGLKAVVPTEGITFVFKGKLYKYTGAFAPANQILGMLKFV